MKITTNCSRYKKDTLDTGKLSKRLKDIIDNRRQSRPQETPKDAVETENRNRHEKETEKNRNKKH